MIGDHHRYIAPFVPLSAQLRDTFLAVQQSLHRCRAQRADRLWLDRHQLPVQKLAAGLHLVRQGGPVFGRAALHHIADVNVCSADRNTLFSPPCSRSSASAVGPRGPQTAVPVSPHLPPALLPQTLAASSHCRIRTQSRSGLPKAGSVCNRQCRDGSGRACLPRALGRAECTGGRAFTFGAAGSQTALADASRTACRLSRIPRSR